MNTMKVTEKRETLKQLRLQHAQVTDAITALETVARIGSQRANETLRRGMAADVAAILSRSELVA